jgi:hypothetical protein
VRGFCRGYEDTRAEGEKQGLDVFFGWEETFEGDDYLIYGLDKEWLFAHPESASWTRLDQFRAVRKYGGCVVQAHPFREADYIPDIHLSTGCVDAVEAANGGNPQIADALAMRYARQLGLPVTAGSDIHHTDRLKTDMMFGVYLTEKMRCIGDYVRAVRENRIACLSVPKGRCDLADGEVPALFVDVRDADDHSSRRDLRKLLKSAI